MFGKLTELENFTRSIPLPRRTKETIDNYVEFGLQPGDFVQAVLENNLTEAYSRADPINTACMRSIVAYIHNETPAASHGSKEKTRAWVHKIRSEKE